jgi:N-acyl-D-aspartate/D-glutamate deacylase
VLGVYAREKKLLTLEEAVRKMTGARPGRVLRGPAVAY